MKLLDKLEQIFKQYRQDCKFIPSKDQKKEVITAKFSNSREPDLRKK